VTHAGSAFHARQGQLHADPGERAIIRGQELAAQLEHGTGQAWLKCPPSIRSCRLRALVVQERSKCAANFDKLVLCRQLLSSTSVVSVPVLDQGRLSRFEDLIGLSTCSSTEIMEGLYIKWEEDGCVRGRYKYVRDSFTQVVEQEGVHWLDRPLEPNQLRDGVDIFADLEQFGELV